jgi:hypothetical protein
MYFQMIRVISSPSSSTTGLVTLIFAMEIGPFWNSAFRDEGVMHPRYSTANARRKLARRGFARKLESVVKPVYIA